MSTRCQKPQSPGPPRCAASATRDRHLPTLLVAGLLLVTASRLPILFGGQTFPDGDESIVGLMAKHISEGEAFPAFFYGQRYGFSLFESGPVAIAFRVLGLSNEALKGTVFGLWAVGWCLFVLAARRWAGAAAACSAGVGLALCPAWAAWSLKARGGYITAFVCMSLCLWLIATLCADRRPRIGRCVTLGIALAVILLSQPIWLPTSLPFLALLLYTRRRGLDVLLVMSGAIGALAIILLATWGGQSQYWSPDLFDGANPAVAIGQLPGRWWTQLTGAFWMTSRLDAGPIVGLAAALWLLAFVLSAVFILRPRSSGPLLTPTRACVLSVVIHLAFSLLLNNDRFAYRYLLPASAPLVLALALGCAPWLRTAGRLRKVVTASLGLLFVCSGLALLEFRRISLAGFAVGEGHTHAAATEELISHLTSEGIEHVYCTDPIFQWTLMFVSHERIVARWIPPTDRVPRYPAAVDDALRSGKPVAIVGWARHAPQMLEIMRQREGATEELRVVADTFFVVVDPGIHLVKRLGFRL